MLKSETRAEMYRANAAASVATAEACQLDRHREQHEASAVAWTRLAEHEDRRTQNARDIEARESAKLAGLADRAQPELASSELAAA